MYNALLALHIAAGSVALTAMWIPMVARKGGRVHRGGGWVFVWAMGALSVTALVMSSWLLFTPDPERGLRLLLLSVLAMSTVSTGVRVLRTKNRTVAHHQARDIGLPVLLMLMSLGVASYALAWHEPSVLGPAVFGLIFGGVDLHYWLRPPTSRMHWWFKHMFAMLGGCVVAANAFASNLTNLQIWPGSLVAMSAVGVIGIPGIAIWMLYYKRRFSVGEPDQTHRIRARA